jgi:Ca2+-transporting ATPase
MAPTGELEHGLTEAEAERRLARDGPNALPVSRQRSVARLLGDVVSEPMLLLLAGVSAAYLLLGERRDALMLLGFVFVVMGISFAQQRRGDRSLDALRDVSSPRALVIRDGQARRISSRDLVLGDIVLLSEGDRVPADMELLESSMLSVDESMQSGESGPVAKRAGLPDDPLGRALAGTLVTQGSGRGRVTAVGAHSALGRIGQALAAIGRPSTPIEQESARTVRRIAVIGITLAGALALVYGLRSGEWLHGLLAGLTLAMAVLPEELPLVLTLFLGLGAWRLARENILARSIAAIELLGATTVLCVDKTGTLTCNRMSVRQIRCASASFDLQQARQAEFPEALHGLLEYALLASHRRAFDPMDLAICDAAANLLANTEHLHHDWTLLEDYPLLPDMLAMSRVWQSPDSSARLIAAKGAPEAIIDLCHLDAGRSAAIMEQVLDMARAGLRVLGVARATFPDQTLPRQQHDVDFVFLGLIALEDPVRPDVPGAIAQCRSAGIRVVMMTGDHAATATAIARQAGMSPERGVMTGAELDELSEPSLRARLAQIEVFCRVRPEQKLRLIVALRAMGEIVAMTGDGVNDAPALKAADIGVAMGARGTDVAREAAALVLLNDDFGSLVSAVRQGRRLFANLRKAMVFVLAAHIPIVGLSIVPVLMGWPLLLMPIHIVFLQLLIDPACSVVLEAEPLGPGGMQEKPRRPGARLFDRVVLGRSVWQGAGLLLLLLAVLLGSRYWGLSAEMARTVIFIILVLASLGLILANRSWERPFWRSGTAFNRYFGVLAALTLAVLGTVLAVPRIGQLFGFSVPTPGMLASAGAVALLGLFWCEAVKKATR